MDSVVEITTNEFTISINDSVFIRSPDKSIVEEVLPNENTTLPPDPYILDLSGTIKIYVYVNTGMEITNRTEETHIVFDTPSKMTIGARSYHTRPAGTITTTTEPKDVMKAVSRFGSALKSTTAERSFPTLRGHPPTIELGDQLDIPAGLHRPNTGIRIEIPPTLRHIFVISPLAYYLGAKVVPGSDPRLFTDSGFSHNLCSNKPFETAVERLLKQTFLLDCIIRTEGETPLPLVEREIIDSKLELDIENLYGRPLSERLERYLTVDFDTIQTQIPEWWPEARIELKSEHLEFLPFLLNDLTIVKPAKQVDHLSILENRTAGTKPGNDRTSTISSERTTHACQQIWEDESGTEITSTRLLSACWNGITQSPRDGPLQIEVVCNDPDMNEELVTVHSTYGNREDLPANVSIHHGLKKEELGDVLAQESDFIHYIGHIDTEGFRCTDGFLNAAELDTVGAKAFFLNACRSYKQGTELINAGSIGGIVTLQDIQNDDAVNAGSTIAQLLNHGLPLYGSLHLLQSTSDEKYDYYLLGDGKLTMTHTKQGAPIGCSVRQTSSGYTVTIDSYISSIFGIGGVYSPYIAPSEVFYLTLSKINDLSVNKGDLIKFLNKNDFPLGFDGELRWSTDIKATEI